MLCAPSLIQKQAYSWQTNNVDAGVPAYYARAEPAFQNTSPDNRRRIILGWKVWLTVTTDRLNPGPLFVRVDVGGGQNESETDDARPLVSFRWPETFANRDSFFPEYAFAAPTTIRCWERDNLHHATYYAWPGCAGCLPLWCEDTVRCLIRSENLEPEFVWSARVNLTLWIGSQ